MKYEYKYFGHTQDLREIIRPVIPVTLQYGSQKVDYEVLADSGADSCVFDMGIGEILGIDFKKAKKVFMQGATGSQQIAYLHTVMVCLGSKCFTTDALFTSNMRHAKYGILGQQGFFEHFEVVFSYPKKIITITPAKK